MITHAPVLLVIIPLVTALVLPLIALHSIRLARALLLLTLAAVGLLAGTTLSRVLHHGAWRYALGGWEPPWGIEYVVDALSGGMAVLITVIAFLVAVYAGPHQRSWTYSRAGLFGSLYLLLVTGLLGIVLTGDLFNLYVFLEISSLAGYALLANGSIRSAVATFRYLIIGTIAASFYLIGVGYLYALTGSLNMADITARLPGITDSSVFIVATIFMVIGLTIKAALFPMHGWLPDAYTYAPAPVIGFISAVMAKVSAYALFRVLYFVLRPEGAVQQAMTFLSWAAVIGIVIGSLFALAQRDIRRMLAYSSVGQMGYILLGIALGTPAAMIGALLHVLNHAIMKGCLFLIAGGVQWRTGCHRIDDFVGMSRRMPLTMAAFVVAALSMIGLPPTAGFFSKWYLLSGALEANAWPCAAALIFSSLLSAVYFFRIIETSYLRQPDGAATSDGEHADPTASKTMTRHELPARMLVPILVLATGVLVLGFLNQTVVTQVIQQALPLKGVK